MALAYLVSHSDIRIAGVTTVHGLTSAAKGAQNVRGMLRRLGTTGIDVFAGSEVPIGRPCSFPADWRIQSEVLAGVKLPPADKAENCISAEEFISDQLRSSEPPTLFALGPWTNIEKAIRSCGEAFDCASIKLFAMGGTLDTRGNVFSGSIGGAPDPQAEWNFYLDPVAVERVLKRKVSPTLVLLDATKTVAIRPSLISTLANSYGTEATQVVREIISSVENWIEEGHYFAWDALAAVLLVHPSIGNLLPQKVVITTEGMFAGRIQRSLSGFDVMCFMSADVIQFEREFSSTLLQSLSIALDA